MTSSYHVLVGVTTEGGIVLYRYLYGSDIDDLLVRTKLSALWTATGAKDMPGHDMMSLYEITLWYRDRDGDWNIPFYDGHIQGCIKNQSGCTKLLAKVVPIEKVVGPVWNHASSVVESSTQTNPNVIAGTVADSFLPAPPSLSRRQQQPQHSTVPKLCSIVRSASEVARAAAAVADAASRVLAAATQTSTTTTTSLHDENAETSKTEASTANVSKSTSTSNEKKNAESVEMLATARTTKVNPPDAAELFGVALEKLAELIDAMTLSTKFHGPMNAGSSKASDDCYKEVDSFVRAAISSATREDPTNDSARKEARPSNLPRALFEMAEPTSDLNVAAGYERCSDTDDASCTVNGNDTGCGNSFESHRRAADMVKTPEFDDSSIGGSWGVVAVDERGEKDETLVGCERSSDAADDASEKDGNVVAGCGDTHDTRCSVLLVEVQEPIQDDECSVGGCDEDVDDGPSSVEAPARAVQVIESVENGAMDTSRIAEPTTLCSFIEYLSGPNSRIGRETLQKVLDVLREDDET